MVAKKVDGLIGLGLGLYVTKKAYDSIKGSRKPKKKTKVYKGKKTKRC